MNHNIYSHSLYFYILSQVSKRTSILLIGTPLFTKALQLVNWIMIQDLSFQDAVNNIPGKYTYSSPLFKLKNFNGTSCLQPAPKIAVSSNFFDLFLDRRFEPAWNWLHDSCSKFQNHNYIYHKYKRLIGSLQSFIKTSLILRSSTWQPLLLCPGLGPARAMLQETTLGGVNCHQIDLKHNNDIFCFHDWVSSMAQW